MGDVSGVSDGRRVEAARRPRLNRFSRSCVPGDRAHFTTDHATRPFSFFEGSFVIGVSHADHRHGTKPPISPGQ